MNRGYAINTNEDIPGDRVAKYKDLVKKVESDSMSNSQAHNAAAADWLELGHYAGYMANRMAGMYEGAKESVTGKQ